MQFITPLLILHQRQRTRDGHLFLILNRPSQVKQLQIMKDSFILKQISLTASFASYVTCQLLIFLLVILISIFNSDVSRISIYDCQLLICLPSLLIRLMNCYQTSFSISYSCFYCKYQPCLSNSVIFLIHEFWLGDLHEISYYSLQSIQTLYFD